MPTRTALLTSVLFALNIVLAYSLVRAKENVHVLRDERAELQQDFALSEAQRRGFQQLLMAMPLDSGFLSGVDAARGDTVVIGRALDGVYYILDTACAACAINLPLLQGMAVEHHVNVIGMSITDDTEALAKYISERHISFPVMAQVAGRLMAVTPRSGTPITMVIHEGRVAAYIFGRITGATESDIVNLMTSE